MKGSDKKAIEDKTKALIEASAKLNQREQPQNEDGASSSEKSEQSDDVIDAEFEDVSKN